MLNLIRKDLLITKSYIVRALAILLLYIIIFNKVDKQGIFVIGSYLIVYTFIALSFNYGERVKENCVLKSLPVKKSQVVLAKYATVLVYFIGFLILMYITMLIIYTLNFKNIIEIPRFKTISLSLGVILCSMSVQLPIYFKFNHMKGRVINTIIYFIVFFPILMIYDKNHLNNYIQAHDGANAIYEKYIIIITITGIILFIISSILSMKIYEKEEIL